MKRKICIADYTKIYWDGKRKKNSVLTRENAVPALMSHLYINPLKKWFIHLNGNGPVKPPVLIGFIFIGTDQRGT